MVGLVLLSFDCWVVVIGCLVVWLFVCLFVGWVVCCRLTVKTPHDFQSKADVPI